MTGGARPDVFLSGEHSWIHKQGCHSCIEPETNWWIWAAPCYNRNLSFSWRFYNQTSGTPRIITACHKCLVTQCEHTNYSLWAHQMCIMYFHNCRFCKRLEMRVDLHPWRKDFFLIVLYVCVLHIQGIHEMPWGAQGSEVKVVKMKFLRRKWPIQLHFLC